MKSIVISFFALLLLFSCSKEVTTNETKVVVDGLLSEWRLIEAYADPGDGSGEYAPYEGDEKIVNFFEDSTITSNITLCQVFGSEETGIFYSNYTADQVIPQSCNLNFDYYITYSMNDSILILGYLCIEGCWEKYERID